MRRTINALAPSLHHSASFPPASAGALDQSPPYEILTLRWEHVSEEHECLMLPDSKTGRKAIHLNAPALALLQTIPRLDGNPYVVCGEKAGQHLVNLQKPWRRIRAAAKLDGVRLHDLRHLFASVAASGGQSLVVIGKMLGHSQPRDNGALCSPC